MVYTFSPPNLVNTLDIGMCAVLNAYLVLYIHCAKTNNFWFNFATWLLLLTMSVYLYVHV